MADYKVNEAPQTWKGLATVAVGAILEIGVALHRIARALEGDGEDD